MTRIQPAMLLVGLALAACKPKDVDLPICPEFVGSDRAEEADTRTLPPEVWFQVLVPRISRPALMPPDDPRECSGRAIAVEWREPEAAARDPRSRAKPLERRNLTEADLTFGEGPDGTLLIWARIEFFDDGTARGPVALARWAPRGLEIRGIGTLWAPYRRARLRLEPLGDEDHVLIADAELCPDTPASTASARARRCRRDIYLLPLIDQRFVQAGLIEDGTPVGPARIVSFEQRELPARGGLVRRSEVQRSLRVVDGQLRIAEAIQIRDCDTKAGELCEKKETIRATRKLTWDNVNFIAERSAWEGSTPR